jgi:hypothetical protein
MAVKINTFLFATILLSFPLISAPKAFAELRVEHVYPTLGVVGQSLETTLTGSGFSQSTRVSMALDVGHSQDIIGSVKIPGSPWEVEVLDDIAYVADRNSGLQMIDISTWILHVMRRYELCPFIFYFSTIDRGGHPAVFIQDFYLSFAAQRCH